MKKNYSILLLAAFALCSCNESVKPDDQTVSSATSSILNGKLDDTEAHRAVVAFRTKYEPNSTFCTGTLIAPNYVLSAAHCFAEIADQYTITQENGAPSCEFHAEALFKDFQAGWKNSVVSFGNNDNETSLTQYEIDEITVLNEYGNYINSKCNAYGGSNYEQMLINDIALIKLKDNVPESIAKPIPALPPWLGQNDELYAQQMMTEFVGFGYNENGEVGYKLAFKRELEGICKHDGTEESSNVCYYNEPIYVNACHPSIKYCDENNITNETYNSIPFFEGTMFYRQDDGGPCQGDSGGPALVKIGGREYLAGITSYGDSACAGYGISTDVQTFYDSLRLGEITEIKDQYIEICGNGIDDDGNGLTDADDLECGSCSATFTFYNQHTNKESGGNDDFDVYLVGSFNTTEDGTWILNDDKYKMTSDGKGTHTITLEYPKNASFEYKYHVKGWVDADNNDNGWFSDAGSNGNAVADFSICGKRYGIGSDEIYCGDGILQEENNELCDNADFPENMDSCSKVDVNYISGKLKCTADCHIDLSQCSMEEDTGGIGNAPSNNTRTSIPTDPNASKGSITLSGLMNKPAPTGLPDSNTTNTDDQVNPDTPEQPASDPVTPSDDGINQEADNHDDGDDCSAVPLRSVQSLPGVHAILFGLAALIGLRRRKEN